MALQDFDGVAAIEMDRTETDFEKLCEPVVDLVADVSAESVRCVWLEERSLVKLGDCEIRDGFGFVRVP